MADNPNENANKQEDPMRFHEPLRTTSDEVDYRTQLENYIDNSIGSNVEKFAHFPKYVPTQDIRRFVTRYEIFKKVLGIHGSIVECGVLFGGGLLSWAQFSEVHEPFNHLRKIVGFDTFEGLSGVSSKDQTGTAKNLFDGGLSIDTEQDLNKGIEIFDQNRVLKHIKKIELVRGNASETIPKFIEKNPHFLCSLLWLDFDIYQPTFDAIEHFLPRMSKGSIIAFDELNHPVWPGETVALIEKINLRTVKIERFSFGSTASFIVLD